MTTKLEEVARALAKDNGDDFDSIPRDKAHWVEMGQGRGVNELRQRDYLCMARAAVGAMEEYLEASRNVKKAEAAYATAESNLIEARRRRDNARRGI
jgi:hypothetical protein